MNHGTTCGIQVDSVRSSIQEDQGLNIWQTQATAIGIFRIFPQTATNYTTAAIFHVHSNSLFMWLGANTPQYKNITC
jgi:hypothetical protein